MVAASDTAGRGATSPWEIPAAGWKAVLQRTWAESTEDNIGLIDAGVSFYGFLALVPMLGAIVLSYGLLASPDTVMREMQSLTSVMPADAAKLVGDQLLSVVESSHDKKGFGLLLALGIALYGAMKGASAIVIALNVAYEQPEKRGFVALNLLALAMTVGAVVLAIVAVIAIAALGHLQKLIPGTPDVVLILGKLASYTLMAGLGAAAAATLYRYGPCRTDARWTWLTPGSVAATLLWLLLTLGFGVYAANFGSYNATYGSLAAVVVMLTWLYLSAYVFLLGAELNSELERQTAQNTTRGAPKPLGQRGAVVADMVAGEEPPRDATEPPTLAPPETTPSAVEDDVREARRRVRDSRQALTLRAILPSKTTTVAFAGLTGAYVLWRRRARA